jgi:dihydroxyacid dehydratase/phosphogluconate dehydratase
VLLHQSVQRGLFRAAIHCSPEALAGGALARVRDGDIIRMDAVAGALDALVPAGEWLQRTPATLDAVPMAQALVAEGDWARVTQLARQAQALRG